MQFKCLFAIALTAVSVVAVPTGGGGGSTPPPPPPPPPPPAPIPPSQCNTGPIQCCNSVQSAGAPAVSAILALLGINIQDVNIPIGVTCSPISVIGLPGNSCSAQPMESSPLDARLSISTSKPRNVKPTHRQKLSYASRGYAIPVQVYAKSPITVCDMFYALLRMDHLCFMRSFRVCDFARRLTILSPFTDRYRCEVSNDVRGSSLPLHTSRFFKIGRA
ncbi:hypothetical protein NMY22_g8332 [Coprinellus aureogranulatus]|nr:hypothetical protein NMY22_g8332 [Coprinellus aureogranulatus]